MPARRAKISSPRGRLAGSWIRILGMAGAGFLLVATLLASGMPSAVDLPVRDAILRALPSRSPAFMAVIAIDEKALDAFGAWPWPRKRLAGIIEAAKTAGARGIAVDILLAEPAEGDDRLGESLSRLPSVLVAALDTQAGWIAPKAPLWPPARLAETSFDVDHDGVVRRFSSTKQRDGLSLPALPLALAGMAKDSAWTIRAGSVLIPDFRCHPHDIPVVSVTSLLSGQASVLRNRVAVLGVTAAGLGDRYITPGSKAGTPRPGVIIHAAAAECILGSGLLRPIPPLFSGVLAGLLVIFCLSFAGTKPPYRRMLLAMLVPVPVIGGTLLLLAGVEIPIITLSLAAAASAFSTEFLSVFREEKEAASSAAARKAEEEARRVAVHEMKTPLTAVRGLTQLLTGLELTQAERQRVAAMMGEETERLGGLIESLNAIERLRLREFDKTAQVLDISALTGKRVASLGTALGGRVSGTFEEGIHVEGDEGSLTRAIDNLIGNALKFSPDESTVLVSVLRRGENAVISVADEGPGIPEEERGRVFGRFVRGTNAGSMDGLGLGLSLVEEVVTWHRGRVLVKGRKGSGSVFEILLPLSSETRRERKPEDGRDSRG